MRYVIVFSALLMIDTVLFIVSRRRNRQQLQRQRIYDALDAKVQRFLDENPGDCG